MPLASNSTDLDLREGLKTLNQTYVDLLDKIFDPDASSAMDFYAERIPTDSESTQVDMLADFPVIREWKGPRIEKYLRSYKMTVEQKTWEGTVSELRRTVKLDKSGKIERKMAQFLQQAKYFYPKYAMTELQNNKTCYDGTALIGSSHPHANAGGTWSNTSTNRLTRINYTAAVQAADAWRLEQGEYAQVEFDTLLCGPKLKDTARRIFQADQRAAVFDHKGDEVQEMGVDAAVMTNVYKGELNVVVDKRISGSTYQYYWYLIDSRQPKPVMILEATPPTPQVLDDPEDHNVFFTDRFVWGIMLDANFAPGNPRAIYGNLATEAGS